ncbi:GspH/FimT family pseudopilin [Delftia sp. PS-11]|uniref:GspH/FimT family pseudopilin n=1 Tax=Delftia sp. PS-11 TaxID=2767222 RepID=UPI0024584606|nr:GspH/FimT family pseudopilin [Delftia sp. PS-11]KAJ8740883.1 GspH/FimT family pseudopilin [Delftia sp. PS-11]
MKCKKPLRQGGFSLIELMVALTILGVLASFAAPSFVSFQRNSELTSATNKLLGAINTARSEAMKTGRNAYVIPASGTDWSTGWRVYVDLDGSGSYSDTSDALVLTERAPPSYISVALAGTATSLGFNSSGYARDASGNLLNTVMTIRRTDTSTASANEETRRIVVALTGRSRACKPSTDTSCTTSAAN